MAESSPRDRAAETLAEAWHAADCGCTDYAAGIDGEAGQYLRTAHVVLAHPEALSALAGVPHPGVEALAEAIDPAAFDPRRMSARTAHLRGKRQRAALDAAERVRALLGHTPDGET